MANQYHEPVEEISQENRDITRALHSLKEEIEATDWYNQRAATTQDESIRRILIHNRDEEIEHAAMVLEWLRRRMPAFDENLRTYLFTSGPIDQIEEAETSGGEQSNGEDGGTESGRGNSGDLGIGGLK